MRMLQGGKKKKKKDFMQPDGYLQPLLFVVPRCVTGRGTGEPFNLACDWTNLSKPQSVTDKTR